MIASYAHAISEPSGSESEYPARAGLWVVVSLGSPPADHHGNGRAVCVLGSSLPKVTLRNLTLTYLQCDSLGVVPLKLLT